MKKTAGSSQAMRATENRELVDTLTIFSIAALASTATIYTDGLSLLRGLSHAHEGPQFDNLTIVLLFFGVALAIFGARRVIDQRMERRRRILAEDQAHSLAYEDPLTRLPNRRQFELDLEKVLKAGPEDDVAVLLVQIGGLQELQQLHGQAGVETALMQIGARLRRLTSAGPIARFGDDEFAVATSNADPGAVGTLAADLLRMAKEPIHIGVEKQAMRAIVGIAQTTGKELGLAELLRRAHVALHHAKLAHIDSCFFEGSMDDLIRDRLLLERDLREALGTDAIQPYYQPIVDLTTGRIVSFEALARWTHPERGPIGPTVFIPLAEDLGIIDELTGQLFGQACRDATQWPDEVSLSFNFSPCQLGDVSLAEAILVTLSETGLPPHRLEAEVTEGALFGNLGAAREVLSTLRAAGVRIVMDDFGTGYSSLYHLRQLQFDKLKIDRSFIEGIADDSESAVIVRSIMGMSEGLDLIVTAEGIENVRQALGVTSHGVQQAQGYLYGRPMPADEALKRVSPTPPRAPAEDAGNERMGTAA